MNVNLFGTFAIKMDNGAVEQLATNKERALLGYLAAQNRPNGRIPRTYLAVLLWCNQSETVAKRNLRNALARIKRRAPVLVDSGALAIQRTTVQLRESADIIIDLQTFDRLWTRCQPAIWSPQLTPAAVDDLIALTDLYRGEFLSGLSLDDCEEIETWVALVREERQLQTVTALQRLADHYLDQQQFYRAEQYARHQLKLEQWHEAAHRQLIQIYRATGRHRLAKVQYDRLAHTLRETFHTTPSPETTLALRE